ncbi:ATP-binding protein [Iodidimonas sp. SYSU 1G8]|uniref:ATP-binding protein n=1 Tax=Iodidimonas sp. SYSU 1G8 TaxID=3133967 RepID=UPI0031FF2945
MEDDTLGQNEIDATPTKGFFIDMLTRDIPLDQAILDLVDNSVDGAKAMRAQLGGNFSDRWVKMTFDADHFSIIDNCGGFGKDAAKKYAFKFGRPDSAVRTPHSIGQFGVGMKRALFKFGRHFVVRSATTDESWEVEVPVDGWESEPGWHFPIADIDGDSAVSTASPGTEIIVTQLRAEVSSRFSLTTFRNTIFELIKSKHRQFIAEGLSISVNGHHVDATSLHLLTNDGLIPGTDNLTFKDKDKAQVDVRIIVAVGPSSPRKAGWYVVCNGRVILEADRSPVTGWGLVEEAANTTLIPSYHNQYARFRGLVFFDSEDSSQVPWNTTKTSVDQDNKFWQAAFVRMTEMMRPVINFLNELDADIDEYSRWESPLAKFIEKARMVAPDSLHATVTFKAPARSAFVKGPKTIKIQYSRPVEDVELLQEALDVHTAKAVGEATFDAILKRQKRG